MICIFFCRNEDSAPQKVFVTYGLLDRAMKEAGGTAPIIKLGSSMSIKTDAAFTDKSRTESLNWTLSQKKLENAYKPMEQVRMLLLLLA